jgi:ATP-binding cassette subfamily F protein 3
LGKAYGDNQVFAGASFTINRGDKVAFVGKNGAGKSTLVKSIIGQITDYTGALTIGHNVKIGYFAQNQAQLLDDNQTVFETVDYVAQGDIRTKIRDILGAFMFGGEASDKKVKVLSGGERSRLAMIRLLLEPVNLLILDEPTNHLDMQSKDVLKSALREFDGTIIVVSHDREFLNGLVDKVYEFGDGKIKEHLYGIYEFLEKKKLENLVQLERKDTPSVSGDTPTPDKSEGIRLSYEERKELTRQLRKLESQLKKAEEAIKRYERELAETERRLSTPEESAAQELYARHDELKKSVEREMEEWTRLTIALEEKQKEEMI